MNSTHKFILHVVNNIFPLNEYSDAEVKRLIKIFKDEADEKNIEIEDKLLAQYIQQFDRLKSSNHPEIKDREIRNWPLQKLIKLVSKYVEEEEEEWDSGLEVVYEEGPISIWNGSEEDRCIKYARNESPWCIGKGSFMNYRADRSKGSPVFYLCMNRDLPKSNKLSFVAVQVRDPEVKQPSQQYVYTNRINKPYESEPMSWDKLMSEIPWLRTIPNLKELLKYIPLSPMQKKGSLLRNSLTAKQWATLPLNYKKQYLINRKDNGTKMSDIDNVPFLTKYIAKTPALAKFVSENGGLFQSEDLLDAFEAFDSQSQKSILANLHTKINPYSLYKDSPSFIVKRLITFKNAWNVGSSGNRSIFLADDNKAIVDVTVESDGKIKLGYLTEDEEHENVKITKNTAKYLVNWPDLQEDGNRIFGLSEIAQLYGLNQDLNTKLDAKLKQTEEVEGDQYDISKVEKDGDIYYIDNTNHKAFKKEKWSFKEVPVKDVEDLLGGEVTAKAKKTIVDTVFRNMSNRRERFPSNFNLAAAASLISTMPYDERDIDISDNSRYSGILFATVETPTFFTKPYKDTVAAGAYNEGRYTTYGVGLDESQWAVYFKYLRDTNQVYNTRDVETIFNSAVRERSRVDALKAWINSNPPLQQGNTKKLVIHNDESYLLDLQTKSESKKMSSSANIVRAVLNQATYNQLAGIQAPQPVARPAAAQPAAQQAVQQAVAQGERVQVGPILAGAGMNINALPTSVRNRVLRGAVRLDTVNERGARSRNQLLGNRGRVTAIYKLDGTASAVYMITLTSGTQIASIAMQPGNYQGILAGGRYYNMASATDLDNTMTRHDIREAKDELRFLVEQAVLEELRKK